MDFLIKKLKEKNLTIASCESVTGGHFSENIVKINGASEVYLGGVIAYSNNSKINVVNVNPQTIQTFGSVSVETAIEMANNIKRLFNSDIGISFTGLAGSESNESKPIGLVYIAVSYNEKCLIYEYKLSGTRKEIINKAAQMGIKFLKEFIKKI